MADLLKPIVSGTIYIEFSKDALTKHTTEERNEYLKMITNLMSNVLDECHNKSDMMANWQIRLYEKPND